MLKLLTFPAAGRPAALAGASGEEPPGGGAAAAAVELREGGAEGGAAQRGEGAGRPAAAAAACQRGEGPRQGEVGPSPGQPLGGAAGLWLVCCILYGWFMLNSFFDGQNFINNWI